ncbi:MAG TPA: FecR domain-containing protein [Gemmatimonadaceae bacterium]|nr:FecR domain-containing protein [Gemmatimonadaceae bacterium]
MRDPLGPELVDRYLAGEATADELALIDAHCRANPHWAATIDALRESVASAPADRWREEAAWTRLRSRLDTASPSRATRIVTPPQGERRPQTRRWLVAATVLIAAGAGTFGIVRSRQNTDAGDRTFANEIVTPNGTRQTITLGDGSRVTLNAGSRLRWAADYGVRVRDVHLDGEAYFAVTHDATRPFRVHARGTVAHDLGTRFTVRAYDELAAVEVVVAEGAVSLRHDAAADSAIIGTGQLGKLGASGSPTVESNVAVERWTAWTGGSLVLEGLTLANALPQLERWYDADFIVADPQLAARRVSARFHDETLPQMLDALTLALGATWRQSGRTITLSSVKP